MVRFECKFFEMMFPDQKTKDQVVLVTEVQRKNLNLMIDVALALNPKLQRVEAIELIQEVVMNKMVSGAVEGDQEFFVRLVKLETLRLELVVLENSKPNGVTKIH